jgi:imidazoleglycerol-phosphate dehydratase
MTKRKSSIKRTTQETNINLTLNLDGTGKHDINTGIKMLDHLLSQTIKHGRFDLKLTASGDDEHHVTEDIAICLGKAFNEALGEKLGIVRMADATVPMDEALANVAVDLSGRGYCIIQAEFTKNDMRDFQTDLIRHFLESFAMEGRLNIHARVLYGINDHHKAEALFKALGRALDMATRIDARTSSELPSTKQRIEK